MRLRRKGEDEVGSPYQAQLVLYLRLSVALWVLFALVYGGTNWLTSRRSDHYRLYADWELAIPFIPGMITVYFSLCILFLLPVFWLTEKQLKLLAQRMAVAILVAGMIYLILPARLGFDRVLMGDYELVFRILYSLELPHNLFPSLHIALGALVVGALQQHWGLSGKILLVIWMILLCSAVLLVHQHHIIDVVGGFMLAGASQRLVKGLDEETTTRPELRDGERDPPSR